MKDGVVKEVIEVIRQLIVVPNGNPCMKRNLVISQARISGRANPLGPLELNALSA